MDSGFSQEHEGYGNQSRAGFDIGLSSHFDRPFCYTIEQSIFFSGNINPIWTKLSTKRFCWKPIKIGLNTVSSIDNVTCKNEKYSNLQQKIKYD